MNKNSITKPIDKLGRIVIPVEFRNTLSIKEYDLLEMSIENSTITLQKKVESCIFCHNSTNLTFFNNFFICSKCINKINNLKK